MKLICFFKNKNGQTAIELAIFGGVIVFIIGAIVRQAMGSNQFQAQQLRAMRMAMMESHMYSEGLKGAGRTVKCGTQLSAPPTNNTFSASDGSMSRNTSSVMLIEDRLSVGSAKTAEIDRTPIVAQGTASHTRNFRMPFDPGECHNIGVFDLYINGKHFPLLIADFVEVTPPGEEVTQEVTLPDGTKEMLTLTKYYVYEKVPNHPAFAAKWKATDPKAFDLRRDGSIYAPEGTWMLRGTDGENGRYFSWQWHRADALSSEASQGAFDIDGDLKEESILKVAKNELGEPVIYALDYQEGDIDFSVDDYDTKVLGLPTPGLENEMEMYTEVRAGDGGERGTYLLIQEGQLYANKGLYEQVVRSVRRKDQVDLVSRRIRLSRNTGRFCDVNFENRETEVDGLPNPVEVCCQSISCCFEPENQAKTCMAPDVPPTDGDGNPLYDTDGGRKYPVIFVRSRIRDERGRKWITNIQNDPTLGILATE